MLDLVLGHVGEHMSPLADRSVSVIETEQLVVKIEQQL